MTQREGEEADKFNNQIFSIVVNESDYILQNSLNMNDVAIKNNIWKQYQDN